MVRTVQTSVVDVMAFHAMRCCWNPSTHLSSQPASKCTGDDWTSCTPRYSNLWTCL